MTKNNHNPGFQGSETSWVEVNIYQQGDDPILTDINAANKFTLDGKRSGDTNPSLLSVQTDKGLNETGTFVITVKPSDKTNFLFDKLLANDWVDLTFYRHDQPWHTMRGLIDEIRLNTLVGGSGATMDVYTITGRDFGKIWELTPIWFSPFANDIVTDAISNKIYEGLPELKGSPSVAVDFFLKKFLEELASNEGPNWNPPTTMPNIVANQLLSTIKFNYTYFQNVPARQAFNANAFSPNGNLWSLAQQYSDPLFTEFYVDILPEGDCCSPLISEGTPVTANDTRMTVVVRDKPFPICYTGITGYTNYWDKIPIIDVPAQQINTLDVGRSDFERFNTYFVCSDLLQDTMSRDGIYMLAPIYDKYDIKKHGMRRMDIQSMQQPAEGVDVLEMLQQLRYIARDWYCLNHYFLNGTINLGLGRPDIKVGTRVRIPSNNSVITFYVERINHNWSFGIGTRTNLTVTRGWTGSDDSYLEALDTVIKRYDKEPQLISEAGIVV